MELFLIIGFIALIGGAILIVFLLKGDTKTVISHIFDLYKEMFGEVEIPKYAIRCGYTGIAISNDLKRIALLGCNISKVYNVQDIRGHDIRFIKPDEFIAGKTHGVGVRGSITAAIANLDSSSQASSINRKKRKEAEEESGLFIRVKDVDNPVWQISIYDEYELSRWNEILNQLYEGNLSST